MRANIPCNSVAIVRQNKKRRTKMNWSKEMQETRIMINKIFKKKDWRKEQQTLIAGYKVFWATFGEMK
jgi:hypothetical protein